MLGVSFSYEAFTFFNLYLSCFVGFILMWRRFLEGEVLSSWGGARTFGVHSFPLGVPFFAFLLALTQQGQEWIMVRALTFSQSPWPHVH